MHQFDYTAVDLQQQYIPPALTGISQPQTHYAYNLDKQLIQIQRPDGQAIDFVYDAEKKRLNRIEWPNNAISYTYHNSTGQLITLTTSNLSTLNYTYDGALALSETWGNGEVNGTVSLDYNNDFRVTAISVNGESMSYQYDNDGLLIQAGELSLTRHPDNGLLTQTQLGDFNTERTYNAFGEVTREMVFYGEQIRYNTAYQRDNLGRITQKRETIDGVTTTYAYHYDLAGRLEEVQQNDVIVETYTYDDNGNRQTADTARGSVIANYDDQDRLTQYGNTTYTYTNNGELLSKNSNGQITQYQYDVLGNLRAVQLPNGKQIAYVIDARNRRIGKKVNGVLMQSFLYQGSLNPVAELDGNGNVVSRFVYGSKANIPDYMHKNGNTYRILSDHLGSPRLVVDISTGYVAQRMDYDAFGNVIFDSNPGFQPFGFAGGIYDTDTKLTRFGYRDYDAQTGRWTAKDPILFDGGDANLYGYVLNDPVNSIDPFGLTASWGDCATRCGAEVLGLEDLIALGLIGVGQPIPGSKRFRTPGSSAGTSLAGKAADKIFGRAKFPRRVATIVGGPGTGRKLAIAYTTSVARATARMVPIVGWVLLGVDVIQFGLCMQNCLAEGVCH